MARTRTQAAAAYLEKRIRRGDRSLAAWHLLLRRVTFGSALALMFASYVSLHWALDLVTGNALIAYGVPLFLETGMAAVASTATTIRKRKADGSRGGYYVSLWLIFSFVMALAQAANIGHAMVVVEPRLATLPAFIPDVVVYIFAGTFAALFPLGGTMFVHVSGFLRDHSIDADWIDADAEVVTIANPDAHAPAAAATQAPASARTQPAPRPAAPTHAPALAARTQAPATHAPAARTQAPATAPQVPARDEQQAPAPAPDSGAQVPAVIDLRKPVPAAEPAPTAETPTEDAPAIAPEALAAVPLIDDSDALGYTLYAQHLIEQGTEMKGRLLGEELGIVEASANRRRAKQWRPRFQAEYPEIWAAVQDGTWTGRPTDVDPQTAEDVPARESVGA